MSQTALAEQIRQQVPLQGRNTLGVDSCAQYFYELTDANLLPELLALAEANHWPVSILGGGSNVILPAVLNGLVVAVANRGCQYQHLPNGRVQVRVAAGENWHQLVMASVEKGLSGLENLALIPGTVGAAPVQNIGAYGVELADCLVSVTGWDSVQKTWRTLTADECELGYRDSIFKRALAQRFIITELCLALSTSPQNNVSYQPLAQALAGQVAPSPADIAHAVIAIRQSKLPDPATLANAGSFFKNPVITHDHYESLKQRFPQLPCYPVDNGHCKVPAGWLLDNAGWKGYRGDCVGIHDQQALVLVNFGGSGADILALAARIKTDIGKRYGIDLDIEPQQLGWPVSGASSG